MGAYLGEVLPPILVLFILEIGFPISGYHLSTCVLFLFFFPIDDFSFSLSLSLSLFPAVILNSSVRSLARSLALTAYIRTHSFIHPISRLSFSYSGGAALRNWPTGRRRSQVCQKEAKGKQLDKKRKEKKRKGQNRKEKKKKRKRKRREKEEKKGNGPHSGRFGYADAYLFTTTLTTD